MSKKMETVYLRVPTALMRQIVEIAKLAGVSPQVVIRVSLAVDAVRRDEKEGVA